MAKLINGNGNPAIYAAEDADLIASLAGNVTCIANVGNKYAATEEDATTIRLDDGVIITKEGRRIQLEAGESDTFYIPTGTSGQTNYYIIGYKLVQNADSTQVAEQFVQKMNSSSETITEDTFRSGATEVYVSVYRVTQVGFTIDSVSGLLPELLDNASIKDNIDQINSDLNDVKDTNIILLTVPAGTVWSNACEQLQAAVVNAYNNGNGVDRSKFIIEYGATIFRLSKCGKTNPGNIVFEGYPEKHVFASLSLHASAVSGDGYETIQYNINTDTWSHTTVALTDLTPQDLILMY